MVTTVTMWHHRLCSQFDVFLQQRWINREKGGWEREREFSIAQCSEDVNYGHAWAALVSLFIWFCCQGSQAAWFPFVIITRLHKQTWRPGRSYQQLPAAKETFGKRVIWAMETCKPGALSDSVRPRRSCHSPWQQPERLWWMWVNSNLCNLDSGPERSQAFICSSRSSLFRITQDRISVG